MIRMLQLNSKEKIFDRRAFLLGCFTLSYTFWALSKPHKCQSLNCAQRKLGGPIKKSSTYKPSPRHILSGHTKGSASEYAIWAYMGYKHRVASLVFKVTRIIQQLDQMAAKVPLQKQICGLSFKHHTLKIKLFSRNSVKQFFKTRGFLLLLLKKLGSVFI